MNGKVCVGDSLSRLSRMLGIVLKRIFVCLFALACNRFVYNAINFKMCDAMQFFVFFFVICAMGDKSCARSERKAGKQEFDNCVHNN